MLVRTSFTAECEETLKVALALQGAKRAEADAAERESAGSEAAAMPGEVSRPATAAFLEACDTAVKKAQRALEWWIENEVGGGETEWLFEEDRYGCYALVLGATYDHHSFPRDAVERAHRIQKLFSVESEPDGHVQDHGVGWRYTVRLGLTEVGEEIVLAAP